MVSGQEQQAQKLLSEAIYQEEVNGKLDEAIKTYQQIVDKFPDDRKVTAEALLHLGLCYEKLGNQEAIKTYKRLVNNFPEQKNQVAVARERLTRLEKPDIKTEEPEGIRIKQIWKEPLLDDLGTVSYDGRFRSYVDWGEGDVAIQDLITGEKKKLTNKASVGGDTEYFALGTAISKNGRLIASSWNKPYNTTDLIIVDVENLSMNNIYSQLGEEVYPAAWLSDKELVATRYFPERNIIQIVSFKIPDKTPKIIKSFEKWQNLQLACSPDKNISHIILLMMPTMEIPI
jgi:tetratricopeptide (TPR) repeat protein